MSPKKKEKRTKYMCLTSVLDCGKLYFGFHDFFNPAMPFVSPSDPCHRFPCLQIHIGMISGDKSLKTPACVISKTTLCVCVCVRVRLYRPLCMYFVFSTSSHLTFAFPTQKVITKYTSTAMHDVRPTASSGTC